MSAAEPLSDDMLQAIFASYCKKRTLPWEADHNLLQDIRMNRIAALLLILTTWARIQAEPADFIQVKGTHFNQNGKPYHFLGSNFWGWGGEGRAGDSTTYTWNKGDDYTGDPPQEPQGRNSVFAQDRTTIKILQQYAKKMNTLK